MNVVTNIYIYIYVYICKQNRAEVSPDLSKNGIPPMSLQPSNSKNFTENCETPVYIFANLMEQSRHRQLPKSSVYIYIYIYIYVKVK